MKGKQQEIGELAFGIISFNVPRYKVPFVTITKPGELGLPNVSIFHLIARSGHRAYYIR
jgi:hypothetical protein